MIDRLALTPQHSLHLVRLADRTLLVGLSPKDAICWRARPIGDAHRPAGPDER